MRTKSADFKSGSRIRGFNIANTKSDFSKTGQCHFYPVVLIRLQLLIEIITLIYYVYFKIINQKRIYKIEINYLKMTVDE
jgi:hypothetical protein